MSNYSANILYHISCIGSISIFITESHYLRNANHLLQRNVYLTTGSILKNKEKMFYLFLSLFIHLFLYLNIFKDKKVVIKHFSDAIWIYTFVCD